MPTAIAVVAALGAAFTFALGSVIQQSMARESGERILRLRLLLSLLRQPRWLAGVGLAAASFIVQAIALAFGPLALVQPLAATDVLFALPIIARRNRRGLTRRDLAGALMITAGIAVFLTVSPPTGGRSEPGLAAWLPVFFAIGLLTSGSAVAAVRVRGRARVVWLAVAAAACFGLLDALTKSTVDIIASRGLVVVTSWEPYALMVAALVGGLFGQSAFGSGALSLSLPVIDIVEPVSAVVIGATVFGERLATSPVHLTLQLAGGAVAAVGIAVLSSSPIVRTETRLTPGLPAPGDTRTAHRGRAGSLPARPPPVTPRVRIGMASGVR